MALRDYSQFCKKIVLVSASLFLLALRARAVGPFEHRPTSGHTHGHWRRHHSHVLDNQAAEGVLVPTFALPEDNGGSAGDPPNLVEDTGHHDLYSTASVHSVSKVEFNAVNTNDAEEATTKGTVTEDIPSEAQNAPQHRHSSGNHGNPGSNMALFVDTGSPLHLGFVNIVDGGYFGSGRHVNSVGNVISGPVPVVYPGPMPVAQGLSAPVSHNAHIPITHGNGKSVPVTNNISTPGPLPEMAKKSMPVSHTTHPPLSPRSDVKNESPTMVSEHFASASESFPSLSDGSSVAMPGKSMAIPQFESEFPENRDYQTTTPMEEKSEKLSLATTDIPNIPRNFVPITVAPRGIPNENQRGPSMAGKESAPVVGGTGYVRVTRGGFSHSTQDRPLPKASSEVAAAQESGQEAREAFTPVVESVNVPVLEGGFVPVTESTITTVTVVTAPSAGGFVPVAHEDIAPVTQNISALDLQGGFVPVTQGIIAIDTEDDFSYAPQSESVLESLPETRPGSVPSVKNTNNLVTTPNHRIQTTSNGGPEILSENFVGRLQRGRINQHRFGSNFNTLRSPDGLARSSVTFNFGTPRPRPLSGLGGDGRESLARSNFPQNHYRVASSEVSGAHHGAIRSSSAGYSGILTDLSSSKSAIEQGNNPDGSLAIQRPVQNEFSFPESRQAVAEQEQAPDSNSNVKAQDPVNEGHESDISINRVDNHSPNDYQTSSSVVSVQRYSVGYEASDFTPSEVDSSLHTRPKEQ
ncbi:uncharacterized protein LOC134771464 [Penaeus indicus]|uniref:uncharacterized protein LOC134771464 n=1 Tax=Penaeus indicus TaxID=29960 RepID=UPI00300C3882